MSYKYKGMGLVNILWSGMSILVICSVGITYFGEKITMMDKIGMALIVAGMVCVLWEGGH
jgi:multidrug transporter EmrE-like cation transporter